MTNHRSADAPSRDALLERAAALVPSLRSRAPEIEAARRIPDNVMQDVVDAGLMLLGRPRRYGGPEIGLDVLYEVARELARGDGSMAWVYIVINSHHQLIGHFPEEVQDEFWSSPIPQAGTSSIPTGKAVSASGGYTLSGKWSYCSGVDFVGWVSVGAVVGLLDDPQPAPDLRHFLVPTSECTIIDDWNVMGLAGTGSKSVVLDNVFVPESRVLSNVQVSSGQTPGARVHSDNPICQAPLWAIWAFSLPAVASGIARGAYDVLVQEFRGRATSGKPDPLFEIKKPAVQLHLAEADALIEASSLLYLSPLRSTFERIRSGAPLTIEQRVRNRRDMTFSMSLARRAAEILLNMAGARALTNGGVVQRALRDLCAASAHPGTNWDPAALSFGSVALGGRPLEPFF